MSNAVDRKVVVLSEKSSPVLGPLLIQVPSAALKGDRGGEKHNRTKLRERRNERARRRGCNMLGDFQGNNKIEVSIEVNGLCEVVG